MSLIKKIAYFFISNFILINNFFAESFSGDGEEHYGLGKVSYDASLLFDNVAKLLLYVAIIAGIAFILTAFLKLKQHWKNPQQIPISQVISMFILGLVLVGIPMLINYTEGSTTLSTGFFYNENFDLQLS